MRRNSANARKAIRIGTRGSPLALAQAMQVRDLLVGACGFAAGKCEILPIRTKGDDDKSKPFLDIRGKGIFCREIEAALIDGGIDIAVHSLKDLPAEQPEGLVVDCVLEREDPRDALVSGKFREIEAIPKNAIVGTSSLRRRAQLLRLRPDLAVIDFRGNVDTRLRKLADGEADAILLAMAGLKRLGKSGAQANAVPVESMLPAAAQGAICIERRRVDDWTGAIASHLNDRISSLQTRAERSFLAGIGGSCELPVGALAKVEAGALVLAGEVLRADGKDCVAASIRGSTDSPEEIGSELARSLKSAIGPDLEKWAFANIR